MKLEMNNVTKTFKDKTAVKDFSMEIQTGECVGLIGPNGAGKSTLIKIIADMMDPTTGDVSLDGKKVSSMKRAIGYLPQFPTFYQWMTAHETLTFMGQLSGIPKKELRSSIPDILAKVGLSGEEHAKISTFSGGMKQRLGIAQTLLHNPSLIVMDEPVSALDPIGRREVLNIIETIKQETTILLSTHILGDAEEICERFVIIRHGEKLEDTTKKDLLIKNSKNKICLEITGQQNDWLEMVQKLDFVQSVERVGKRVKIELADISKHKDKLLQHALDKQINLVNFSIDHDTLEDIFLDLVVEK